MQDSCTFLSEKERLIIDFLKNGPKWRSEIISYLKTRKIAVRTANKILNEMVEAGRLFRVKRNEKVFYRLNDLPDEIKAKLALLGTLRIAQPGIKPFVDCLTTNLAIF